MTLTVVVVVLTLFAYICGFLVGALTTQARHDYRADEEGLP